MRKLIKNPAVTAPPMIILLGFLVAQTANTVIGAWSFIPLALVYWFSIIYVVKPDKASFFDVMKKSTGSLVWRLIAYIPAMFTLVAFVMGLQMIKITPLLTILSVIFILINPVMEEMFWRAWLLPRLPWGQVANIAYSTLLFTLSHYCMWGVFSVTIRSSMMLMPLIIMAILWSVSFLKSGSLRHCVIAHALVDTFNLSVWVFLNLFIPPMV
ncbi:MAG TPA: CPBP family intramembrane metalloprotease [Clostridiaceae bacterium]|nr:CPBP family intramembrane metalloprotease [Clostridiaceae bacterium]